MSRGQHHAASYLWGVFAVGSCTGDPRRMMYNRQLRLNPNEIPESECLASDERLMPAVLLPLLDGKFQLNDIYQSNVKINGTNVQKSGVAMQLGIY
ncbi:hypothetical protein TWF173_003611 [Orbilia oligospora]|nr:hypothetical protein TWF173_003611 [Orbilia oligospora]